MKNSNVSFVSNTLVKATAVIGIVLAILTSSNAIAAIDKSTEAKLIKICHALKSDSRVKLHRTVKQSRLGYKQIAAGLKCNGKSAMEFAMLNNAQKTAGYLARKSNINANRMLAKR
ncbi:DUF3718 domain-containing protein [Aliiglaciecola litoralis]|uniref:DUF3718 domain-containing protein n=1 Tax=Aliiglaciecola litoralis TaxID=582857 RepID=A0ABP3WU19_9ALTE